MPYVKKINGYNVKDEEARNLIQKLQIGKANASDVERLALDNAKLTQDLMEAENLIQELQNKKANASDVEQLANDSTELSQGLTDAENHINELQNGKAEKETVEQLQQENEQFAEQLSEVENQIGKIVYTNPNMLINGDFQVWQRGELFQTEVREAFRYNADRWCHYTNTASRLIKKVDNGIYTEANIMQRLERRLSAGVHYVLSASIDGVVVVLNIVGGTPISNNILEYFSSDSLDSIQIKCNDGVDSQIINWVKLEKGDTPTPFVPRLYAEELSLCERYYVVVPQSNYVGYSGSTGRFWLSLDKMFKLRTTPNIASNVTNVKLVFDGSQKNLEVNQLLYVENSLCFVFTDNSNVYKTAGMYWDPGYSVALDAEIY